MKDLKGKKVLLILVVLIISLSIVFMLKIHNDSKKQYTLERVTEIKYVVLMENEKFGVIDTDGKILVEPKYDEIQIPNPQKPVFICMYNYNEENDEYEINVFNDIGERILYEYIIVEAIPINNSIDSIPYEKSVLKYEQNNKWGLIDFEGNIITKPIYQEIKGLEYKEGLLVVKKDNLYGVINIKGVQIIKNKYDLIECDGYYNAENNYNKAGFKVAKKTSEGYRYGYINYKGKLILKTQYNELDRILDKKDDENVYFVAFKNGRAGLIKNKKNIINHEYEDIFYNEINELVILQKNSKQGVADFSGKIILEIKYDNIYFVGKYINVQVEQEMFIFNINGEIEDNNQFLNIIDASEEGYSIVITNQDKYQVIDKNNKILISEDYDYLQGFKTNYFIAKKDGKTGIIDINNNIILEFKYDIIQEISSKKIIQAIILEDNITELYNFEMEKICSMQKSNIYLNPDYIKISSENDVKYFDNNGTELKNTQIFENELFAINQNGKWGFINKNQEIVVQPIYDMVTEINEYGYAGIKKDGKWGSMDKEGKIIKEPTYVLTTTNPDFIGKYYKVDLGYGIPFYTEDLELNY